MLDFPDEQERVGKLSELIYQIGGGHNSSDYSVVSANENIVVFQDFTRCLR